MFRVRTLSTLAALATAAGLVVAVPAAHAAPASPAAAHGHTAGQPGPQARGDSPARRPGPTAGRPGPGNGPNSSQLQHPNSLLRPLHHRHTAREIHRFLTWFYGDHGPTPTQRDRHVSDFLKAKQARHPDQDVILCAQNTPRDIKIGPVTVAQSAGYGWATVTAHWADGTTSASTAYVGLDSRPIALHDVVCRA